MTPINIEVAKTINLAKQVMFQLSNIFEIDISYFKNEYKVISFSVDRHNQYVYIRYGEKDALRSDDVLISIFNSDIHGELTLEKIKEIYHALTDKDLETIS